MNKLLLICLLAIHVCALGQKSNPQLKGMWVPVNIKIDGNAAEWGNYQTYNSKNKIFYTIANDEKNLYLALHTSDYMTINKIFVGGITFTINSNNSPVSITYPKAGNNSSFMQAKKAYDEFRKDSIKNAQSIADLLDLKNRQLPTMYKVMRIKGIKDVDQPELSIYNEQGIKVGILFDKAFALTYELAIPLKYLGLTSGADKLAYSVRLNGLDLGNGKIRPSITMYDPNGNVVPENMDQLYTNSPTNFDGEYVLAIK